MELIYKEVYFHQYCSTCRYREVKESDKPCDGCLSESMNVYSHKPINWKEDTNSAYIGAKLTGKSNIT